MTIYLITIDNKISLKDLQDLADKGFGDMVKAVVDIEKHQMTIGGELHSDEETILLETGSQQKNIWGINIYPANLHHDWIEFDSMINIRPRQNNRSRNIENEEIRNRIIDTVKFLLR